MGILSKTIEVKLWGTNIKHYRSLGYKGKQGDIITVKVGDLSRGCNARVLVSCDYCGTECRPRYVEYYNSIEMDGTYACAHCTIHKAEKTMLKKYGVSNYSSTQECREKVTNTMLSRYGVDHVSKSEEFLRRKCDNNKEKYGVEYTFQVKEFRDKGIQTSLEKYGVEYASQSEEIQERIRNTTEQKYGVPYASQSEEIKEKMFKTNLKKYGYKSVLSSPEIKEKISNTVKNVYGVDNISQCEEIKQRKIQTMLLHYGVKQPSLSDEIMKKRRETFYKNGTTPTSKQQLYIFNLYRYTNSITELNYQISYYSADICFPDENLTIEYNGGFHDGQVKIGRLTQEEFDQKEIIRNNVIKREGYKQMRIISSKDRLPSDTILLQMLTDARNYFSQYPNHSWIEFNIDSSTVRNAECKDDINYDYGELRTIKDGDSQTVEHIA